MSSYHVTVASAQDAAQWDAYVESNGNATAYHEWAWRSVVERAFGHACLYLIARGEGRIVGVLPLVLIKGIFFGRSLTSLPFFNYGGVLADSGDAGRALVEAAGELAKANGCRHVELRHISRQFTE